jgi:DNA-3-methyladenine glycosylase II
VTEGGWLDDDRLREGVDRLIERDPDLAVAVASHGRPPLWPREPGFESLIRTILDQQVSLRSAQAAVERLRVAAGSIDAEAIVALGEPGMRQAGITRQKAHYLAEIARETSGGSLDVEALATASDDAVRDRLVKLPGVGRWTADVYLVLALRRADAWPSGDLALAAGAQLVKRLDRRPTDADLDRMAEAWRPWRGVAARLLWHAYLSSRRRE